MLIKYIDYFAFEQFHHQPDLLYKARLLVGIIFSYIFVLSIFAIFFGLMPAMTTAERLAGVIPVLMLAGSFLAILFVMRKYGHFKLCSHIVIAGTWAGILSGIIMTGGPVVTPSGAMLFLPVFLAFCLMDIKDGFLWTMIVLLVNSTMFVMYYKGYSYPMVTDADMMDITRTFNWYMAFISLIAVVVVYEVMNNQLRRERDQERDRYRQFTNVASDSSVVEQASRDLASASKDLMQAADQQKTAVEQLSVTTEELGATAEQNSALAKSSMDALQNTESKLELSAGDIEKLTESMDEVRQLSEEIRGINHMINEISYQTNLLSLNAMIEASRAGDGNNGFKVVAVEVKKLAHRSAEAAENSNKLLDENMLAVNRGAELTQLMHERFKEIKDTVEPLAISIRNVSDASTEQNEAIRQIMEGLADIDNAIGSNHELSGKVSTMAGDLKEETSRLLDALETLKNG